MHFISHSRLEYLCLLRSNNIYVRPSQDNLDLFIENFRPLCRMESESLRFHTPDWLMTGQIQKEFPELYIKNTILREVTRPNEIVSLAEAGFHYINLDRDLMRDRDSLMRIKKAKITVLLWANQSNYPCLQMKLVGVVVNCTEHYHFNNTRDEGPQFFNDPISRISCSKWNLSYSLVSESSKLTTMEEDWEEFLELGIDVFKMHGRESYHEVTEKVWI